MNLHTPYTVSEWEWLKLQLALHKLESRCIAYSMNYIYEEKEGHITCSIWANPGYEQTKVDNKEKLKTIYSQNALYERNFIKQIVDRLPSLSKEFDVMKHVTIEFLESYGMGSITICVYKGYDIKWHYPFQEKP